MKQLLVIVGVLALIGVGYYLYTKNYSSSSTNTANVQAGPNTVIAQNMAFSPQILTVPVGTEVTFTNNDSTTHTFTFSDFNSGNIAPGQSFKHIFSNIGSFNYHCSIHPSMTGTIVVQ